MTAQLFRFMHMADLGALLRLYDSSVVTVLRTAALDCQRGEIWHFSSLHSWRRSPLAAANYIESLHYLPKPRFLVQSPPPGGTELQ